MKKLLIIIAIALMLTACKKNSVKEPPVVEVKEEEIKEEPKHIDENEGHENEVRSKLTGQWISKEDANIRPVGIMINNLKPATPQSGISQADIIYETLAEGGITRLFAIFQKFDSEKIGPVRSGRHYFLYFALDHDAIYLHYGQSPQTLPSAKEWGVDNLNGLSYLDQIMCFRDNTRKAPHNAYTSKTGIINALDKTKLRGIVDNSFPSKFTFSEQDYNLQSSSKVNKLTLDFSGESKSWFEYDNEDKLYYRYQYNDKHIDKENNEHLTYKNIIVQYTDLWVIKGDPEGRLDGNFVTTGKGLFITNGNSIDITWEKKSIHEPTKYYDMNGKEILLNPGKTWIAVFPLNRSITIE